MNIVVAMKQVPDLTQIRIRDRRPVFDDVVYTFGDLDKNALEAAVELKEAGLDATITVLSIGNEELEDTSKEALAAGADEAYLVCDDAVDDYDAGRIAAMLARCVETIGDVDLVLMGEGSGDEYSGQMVGRLAEALDWPQLGLAGSVRVDGESVAIDQMLEGSTVALSAPMPAVVSVVADINEARVPAVTQILKAGRKPCEVLEACEVETMVGDGASIEILSSLAPENNREARMAGSMQELVEYVKSKNVL